MIEKNNNFPSEARIKEKTENFLVVENEEKKIWLLLDAAAEGIFELDSKGKCILVNQACLSLLGYSQKDDLLGRDVHELIKPSDDNGILFPKNNCNILNTLHNEGKIHIENEFFSRRDGSFFPVEYWSYSIVQKGQVRGSVVAFLDITERRKTDQKIQAAFEEVQRSNRDLEQFAYAASHDLQEPLRSIGGYLGLLSERYGNKLAPGDEKYIQRPLAAVKRMQNLISGLLAFSRIGTHGAAFELIDCNRLLENVLESLRLLTEDNNTIFTIDPLPTVMGDKNQLAQLFQNLISNAIKYRRDEAPKIHIEILNGSESGYWHFAVHDNGEGMEMQFSERIFVLFQRLHTQKESEGSGIGLTLCKKIVERHGGHIWVDSEPGKGSTFHFTLKN
jgi:PAS domain S-box-containing protein